MRYPRSVSKEAEILESSVSAWPGDLDVKFDDVLDWVLQFDEQDFEIAARVVKNLSVVGQRDIDRGMKIAFSKLTRKAIERGSKISARNTLYAGMGDVGKSGAMMSYHFRLNTGISEENFLGPETLQFLESGLIENIVLIDDVIGTGHQARKEIDQLTGNVVPLGVKNIFVLTVCGMRDAIDEIDRNTKAYTFSAFEFGAQDTVASLDAAFYDGVPHDQRDKLRSRLSAYGKVAFEKQPLGYGGIGGLLAFPYNTPNTTVPVVWSDSNDWIPLFRRVRRVNGIAAYQSQFRKAANKRADQPDAAVVKTAPSTDVTLFVEGKRDEIFFDEFSRTVDLAKRLDATTIDVISLASNVTSERLAKILVRTTPRPVFVIDDDHPSNARFHAHLEQIAPVVRLKPSFFTVFDLRTVAERFLGDAGTELVSRLEVEPRDQVALEIERMMTRSGPLERTTRLIRLLVSEYLDEQRAASLIEQLRQAVSAGRPSTSSS